MFDMVMWPIWIFSVADMVFACARYPLAVADMICGRYGCSPIQA